MQKETKIKFYQAKNDGISISITAHLNDGKLSLQGLDHGPDVDEIRGMGEDYEYTLSLDKENSQKLFESLKIADKTDEEKLEKVLLISIRIIKRSKHGRFRSKEKRMD